MGRGAHLETHGGKKKGGEGAVRRRGSEVGGGCLPKRTKDSVNGSRWPIVSVFVATVQASASCTFQVAGKMVGWRAFGSGGRIRRGLRAAARIFPLSDAMARRARPLSKLCERGPTTV